MIRYGRRRRRRLQRLDEEIGLEWNQTSDSWTVLYDYDLEKYEGVQWDQSNDEWIEP